GFAVLLAVKTDQLSYMFMAAAAFVGLAVFQFTSRTLIAALESLIKSTPTKVSSTAFLDCFALGNLLLGLVAIGWCSLRAIQTSSISLFFIGLGSFVFCEYVASVALHP